MIEKLKEWSGVIALLAILLTWIVPSPSEMSLSGNGSRFPNGISADSTSPVDGEVRGTTLTLTGSAAITGSITQTGATTTVNGASTFASGTSSLTAATTTVCARQGPNATSTLLAGSGIRFTTSSTTATVVTIAKASTAFATTTLLASSALAANAQGTIVASTTLGSVALDPSTVFAPNQWMVVSMQGGPGAGNYSPTGACAGFWAIL